MLLGNCPLYLGQHLSVASKCNPLNWLGPCWWWERISDRYWLICPEGCRWLCCSWRSGPWCLEISNRTDTHTYNRDRYQKTKQPVVGKMDSDPKASRLPTYWSATQLLRIRQCLQCAANDSSRSSPSRSERCHLIKCYMYYSVGKASYS